jgi:SulP family sulfate permease
VNAWALTRPAPRDLLAGSVAALTTLAGWLTLGLLAFVPLGGAAPEIGIPAACIAVAVGGLVVAVVGRSVTPAGGLSSATVLIFAAALAQVHADPWLRADAPGRTAALLAVVSCAVIGMGMLQVLFGLLRVGSLARHVPQPVLAGFMNGVALLVLLAQMPLLLGIAAPLWAQDPLAALAHTQPATLAIGVSTAAVVWVVAARFPGAPAALIGLAVGCALYAAARAWMPDQPLGALAGAVPSRLPAPDALAPLLGRDVNAIELWWRHAGSMGVTALLLAVVGSLESVLNALATDQDRHTRHDPNRELIAFGAGNVVSGLFGGLPLVYWRARASALARSGAATRWAVIVCAAVSGLLYLAGGALIALLPLTVLAGIMITVSWSLVDRWSRGLLVRGASGAHSGELWLNLAIVAVVFGVTVWRGFVAAVLCGLLLAMALFIHTMNRSLVRSRWSGAAHPSRRAYPPAQEALLRDARERIVVLELEGALFFGNSDRLNAIVDALDTHTRFIVLDLKRISALDASAATTLGQIGLRLSKAGRSLLLAGVASHNRHGRALLAFAATMSPQHWFADADQAVEAAEQHLLADAGLAIADAEVALDDCALLQGLDAAQRGRLGRELSPRVLNAGEPLFRQGDPGDCLYVLTRGSITVRAVASGARDALPQRYLSLSPGMMLGETAMLDGLGRSADAWADTASTVYALTGAALARLQRDDPVLVAQLMTNVARHLSERLRNASLAWQRAAH